MEAKWLLAETHSLNARRRFSSEALETEGGITMTEPNEFRPPSPLAMLSGADRAMAEQHLVQAEHAVVAGETHIERQKDIVRDMEAKGQDVVLAKQLLHIFLALQKEHLAHRDRLRLELGIAR